jgi:threonine dehydratase
MPALLTTRRRTTTLVPIPFAAAPPRLQSQPRPPANGFPEAQTIGVEPAEASDFQQSLAKGERTRIPHPRSICDGLLSYDVGATNWPILQRLDKRSLAIPDLATRRAMKWLYERHGLRAEPSGAISLAAALSGEVDLGGSGDVVVVLSGRNVGDEAFRAWIAEC